MHYNANEYIQRIAHKCGYAVFFSMLKEECAELIQAVSKYERAVGLVNSPTPASVEEAKEAVREEITDVQMMIDGVLYTLYGTDPDSEQTRDEYKERTKWVRWTRRIENADYSD